MTEVVVVEGNSLLRDGLSALLDQEKDVQVVGTAASVDMAIDVLIDNPKVGVILTNIEISASPAFDFIRACKVDYPETSVIALADDFDHDSIRSSLLAEVEGFVLTKSTVEELLDAVRTVALGNLYTPRPVYNLLVSGYLNADSLRLSRKKRKHDGLLTQKEREILILVAEGLTNKQIAKTQKVGIKTVEKHRGNFMRKLGLKNSAQVARYAVSHGLLAAMERRDNSDTADKLDSGSETIVLSESVL